MRTNRFLAKQVIATYAEALFEAAQADSAIDTVGSELAQVVRIVRGHTELRDALLDEVIPAESRGSIAREVFASMNPAVVATLGIMAERGEVDLLSAVAERYSDVAEERTSTVTVEVTTVVELTEALREAIKSKLSGDFGKTVTLREKVDPSIIGGIVMSAHGKRIDASIASQLEAARMTLSSAHTGGEA